MEILHLALVEDWAAAQVSGEYRTSTRGMSLDEVGFIHASTGDQLAGVAETFYASESAPLVVLVLDEDTVRDGGVEVRFEDGGDGELFPHLYGPIRPDLVRAVRPAGFDAEGRFVMGT